MLVAQFCRLAALGHKLNHINGQLFNGWAGVGKCERVWEGGESTSGSPAINQLGAKWQMANGNWKMENELRAARIDLKVVCK